MIPKYPTELLSEVDALARQQLRLPLRVLVKVIEDVLHLSIQPLRLDVGDLLAKGLRGGGEDVVDAVEEYHIVAGYLKLKGKKGNK